MKIRVETLHECHHSVLTWHSQYHAQGLYTFEIILNRCNERNSVNTKKTKVVGRSVTALAIGMALTIGSASLASASSHHGNGFRDHGVASGRSSNFEYSNNGVGGYVAAVTPTSVTVDLRSGTTTTFTLTPTTTYTEGSAPSTIASLVVGDRVRVQVSSSAATTATAINIELAELIGSVSAVSGNTITITDPQGFSRTLVVSSSTSYTANGAAGTLADVTVGSKILAQGTIDANRTSLDAINVAIDSAQHSDAVCGVITAVTSSSVSVQSHNGTPTTFTITPTTTFTEGSTTMSASALAVGERISVKVSSSAPTTALSIRIHLAELAGNVTAVSGNSITVTNHQGTSETVVVSASTTYRLDGASATLADVVVGSKICAQGTFAADHTTLDALTVKIGHGNDATAAGSLTIGQNENQSDQDGQGNQGNQSDEDSQGSLSTQDSLSIQGSLSNSR
jgi:hypothetical protein